MSGIVALACAAIVARIHGPLRWGVLIAMTIGWAIGEILKPALGLAP